jgi:hypothetical protein
MRTRNKRERFYSYFCQKIKEENEKKPKEEERSLFVFFCEKEKKRIKRQTGRKNF